MEEPRWSEIEERAARCRDAARRLGVVPLNDELDGHSVQGRAVGHHGQG